MIHDRVGVARKQFASGRVDAQMKDRKHHFSAVHDIVPNSVPTQIPQDSHKASAL